MKTGKQMELFPQDEEKLQGWRNYKLTIPLDRLILCLALVPVVLFFTYAWGVKKGKESSKVKNTQEQQSTTVNVPLSPKQVTESTVPAPTLKGPDKIPHPQEQTQTLEEKKVKELYQIQLASFRKEDSALGEKEYLEKRGYNAIITKKDRYYVLFVGGFTSRQEAEKVRQTLRARYKDCFIRKM